MKCNTVKRMDEDWSIEKEDGYVYIVDQCGTIAEVGPCSLNHDAEDRRNAKRIAATPRLFNFALDIHHWLSNPDLDPGVVAAYREAARLALKTAGVSV